MLLWVEGVGLLRRGIGSSFFCPRQKDIFWQHVKFQPSYQKMSFWRGRLPPQQKWREEFSDEKIRKNLGGNIVPIG
jgi:hypothetical protein